MHEHPVSWKWNLHDASCEKWKLSRWPLCGRTIKIADLLHAVRVAQRDKSPHPAGEYIFFVLLQNESIKKQLSHVDSISFPFFHQRSARKSNFWMQFTLRWLNKDIGIRFSWMWIANTIHLCSPIRSHHSFHSVCRHYRKLEIHADISFASSLSSHLFHRGCPFNFILAASFELPNGNWV